MKPRICQTRTNNWSFGANAWTSETVLENLRKHRKHDWHKYIDLAVFQQNAMYHTALGVSPTLISQRRVPLKPNDLRFKK